MSQELQRYLERLWEKAADSIPEGFVGNTPEDVRAATPNAGTELASWAAADHVHRAATAEAVALTPSSLNSEGSAETLARSDHTHNMAALGTDSFIWALILGGGDA